MEHGFVRAIAKSAKQPLFLGVRIGEHPERLIGVCRQDDPIKPPDLSSAGHDFHTVPMTADGQNRCVRAYLGDRFRKLLDIGAASGR
jgi:hypothetical protein